MDRRAEESILELDLDNRKLIIAFALLMLICAGFYVFGFMEGKRQALRVEARPDLGAAPATESKISPRSELKLPASDSAAKGALEKPVTEPLDWYKKVNTRGAPSAKELASIEPKKTAETPAGKEAPKPAEPPRKITYSVQIGAFRKRHEAESKAATLKAKGYEYFIDRPEAGGDFFLLKVGRFDSRASAVATQLKLKKDGFSSFIKSN
jgi:cell division protein FtsN